MNSSSLNDGALGAIHHLDYVVLLCDDMPAMRRFYTETMGFPIYRDLWDGQWLELRVGSILLTLRPRHMVQLKGRSHDGDRSRSAASVQLAFRVTSEEVDACHLALARRGAIILDPPTDQPWKHRTLFFQDPEHNLLEIYADIP